ncbi:MAG: ABC transporter permease [candidate division Zixibacteria bacterium]|nr:ABC transporter permease [candidate division Zixibacteria bacterium]
MTRYAWRYLAHRPSRSALIIVGVALCTVLMMFLVAVYRGVSDGTLDYVRHNDADLWVLQENATNIVRGSSLLLPKHRQTLERVPAVRAISPVLLILAVVKGEQTDGTVYLVGYEPEAARGGPPVIAEGRAVASDSEIVLDDRFARKLKLSVGDDVTINQTSFKVVGLSTGTNAFVIQYAFTTLKTAQKLFGQVKIVSAYLIDLQPDADLMATRKTIGKLLGDVSVFTQEEFVSNNRREMQSGFLPFIAAVCSLSVIVLVAILSLLLTIVVLERRTDFAVMKTLGAPRFFLPSLVVHLALFIGAGGVGLGLILFVPVTQLVQTLSPELCTRTTLEEVVLTGVVLLLACLASAIVPLNKLRTVYAAEVFI